MLPSFLLSLLEITGTMSLLILALLVFSRFWGTKYTSRCRYFLWILVILRLCVPVGMPFLPAVMTFSVPAVEEGNEVTAENPPVEMEIHLPADIQAGNVTVDSPPSDNKVPEPPVHQIVEPSQPDVESTPEQENPPVGSEPENVPSDNPSPEVTTVTERFITGLYRMAPMVFGVWLAGATLVFGLRMGGYLLFTGKLRRSLRLPGEQWQDFCDRLGMKLGLGKRQLPKLYRTTEVHSPMLCGFLRPIVLLPDITLTDNQLTGVLAHELTHRRRQDLWMKLACLVATSLHWFNPLVYLASSRCNREMELSCDELVLAGMDDEVRLSYGKVMLDIVKRCNQPVSSLTTHYTPQKSAVTERFAAILDGSRKKPWSLWALVVLVASVTAGSVFALAAVENNELTIPETVETVEETEGAEKNTVTMTLTPLDAVEVTGHRYDVFFPDPIEPLNMTIANTTLPDGGRSPVPVITTLSLAELVRTNQITPIFPEQDVFAATGGVLSVQNTAYAYVFRKDPANGWMTTRLYTGENGVTCKGVVLHRRPDKSGVFYLLGLLCDDGSVRFHYSEDGYAWQSGATLLPPAGSRFVQYASHDGLGGENLCIAYDNGENRNPTVYLSFDNGRTFTRYDLPLLTAFPGNWTEARFVSKQGGAGSGEFSLDYQLLGAEGSRRVQVLGSYGSTEVYATLYPSAYEPDETMLRQIRYTSPDDLGFAPAEVPGYYEEAQKQTPLDFPPSFYRDAHTVTTWQIALNPSPHLVEGGSYTGRQAGGADGRNYVILEDTTLNRLFREERIRLLFDYADVDTRRSGIPKDGYLPTGRAPEQDGMAGEYGFFAYGTIHRELCEPYTVTYGGEERQAVYEKIRFDGGSGETVYHVYSVFTTDRHLLRYVVAGELPLPETEMRRLTEKYRILEFPPAELY